MTDFPKSETLKSRSFAGLLLSQFLAAFNDHATQIVAIFYSSDMLVRYARLPGIDEKLMVSIVTACFITPFFFFSPLAGVLADKYSKRSIVVFWKLAEVAIMGIALAGFILPHTGLGWTSTPTVAVWSAWLLVLTVFLMGTHSAFFVPAKYGVMPEILHPMVLSRGNGLLEGTSFVAQILGTAFGGYLYGRFKSEFDVSHLEPGREWIIGLVLFVLAIVGAAASLLMARIPAAAPNRPLVWSPWGPLKASFGILRHSRSLVLATVGIAFFLFMTLFMRQTLLFEGEAAKELDLAKKVLADGEAGKNLDLSKKSQAANTPALDVDDITGSADLVPAASKAQIAEFRVAMLISLVGLGVGIGCSLAGYFSGSRLELGLVPIGALFLILLTAALAWVVASDATTLVCLVLIGVSAGLYIVPLYTLLQHRAPKESKGSLVALSNFLNVAGGLVAIVVFYFVTYGLQAALGINLSLQAVQKDPSQLPLYLEQLQMQMNIPRILFLFASMITALMLYLLCRQRPDFVVRSLSWITTLGRKGLYAAGLQNVPGHVPVIYATNCTRFDHMINVLSVTDRFTVFAAFENGITDGSNYLSSIARRTGILNLAKSSDDQPAYAAMLATAARTLDEGHVVGISITDDAVAAEQRELLADLRSRSRAAAIYLPVYCGHCMVSRRHREKEKTCVLIGEPLDRDASWEELQAAIHALGQVETETLESSIEAH